MAITFNYQNGQVSHFALKKVDGTCGKMGHPILVGVFCRKCEHYLGIRNGYVICGNAMAQDDKGSFETRRSILNEIKERAMYALDC